MQKALVEIGQLITKAEFYLNQSRLIPSTRSWFASVASWAEINHHKLHSSELTSLQGMPYSIRTQALISDDLKLRNIHAEIENRLDTLYGIKARIEDEEVSQGMTAFISHSSSDDRLVTELKNLLLSLGPYRTVFNDADYDSIMPDDFFWPKIQQGILDCDAFVVILSHSSVSSKWVKKEVEFARANDRKVIPVQISNCSLGELFEDRDVVRLLL